MNILSSPSWIRTICTSPGARLVYGRSLKFDICAFYKCPSSVSIQTERLRREHYRAFLKFFSSFCQPGIMQQCDISAH